MTIAHGLCGYVAVALLAGRMYGTVRGEGVTIADLRLVGTLVAAGAVLDLLDGPVARRCGSSGLGECLDGICDTVTFGAAPAVVIAASGRSAGGIAYSALIVTGGIYLVAMILRLVRSELTAGDTLKGGFQGIPSAPASSATLGVVALGAKPLLTCVLIGLISVMVVGNFHYPRQRPGLMPIMAGGPFIGLLGVWGLLPLEPAVTVAIILAIVPSAAAAVSTWRHHHARLHSGRELESPRAGSA